MRLVIENRTPQNATVSYRWLLGLVSACQIAPWSENSIGIDSIPVDNGTGGSGVQNYFIQAVALILSDLAVYGLVPAAIADAYNAARGPVAPAWTGLAYRLDGSP